MPSAQKHIDSASLPSNRSFGLVFTSFFTLVAFWPLFSHGGGMRIWALILAALIMVITLTMPTWLSPFNLLWTKLGEAMHRIISPVAMGIVYYIVLTPTGCLLSLLKKDLLRLRKDPMASSYWIERPATNNSPDSFKLPF